MGHIVIVGYRPKPGKREELLKLTASHVPRLRKEGLVTNLEPVVMEAADGTIVEVFEWKDEEAVQAAHSNAEVQLMWREYAAVCDYVPIGQLPESQELFAGFASIE